MSEDAPVNAGAVAWPQPDSAYFTVRSMQTKLHRWAGEDLSRRFGDLFNRASCWQQSRHTTRGTALTLPEPCSEG